MWGHETIDGTFRQTNLRNEPNDYLAKREELRLAEIELMKQRERVAEMRRALPQGAVIPDYEFLEGPRALDAGDAPIRKVKISELFSAPERPLDTSRRTWTSRLWPQPSLRCCASLVGNAAGRICACSARARARLNMTWAARTRMAGRIPR
jgi:predicted dithiol-disulfide oxidoreductase (DUF899 family)